MDIVIPLKGGTTDWDDNELKILMRSLGEGDDVYVLTNKMPEWLTNVKYIHVERYYPDYARMVHGGKKHHENYFDVLNKLMVAAMSLDIPNRFVWCYDDIVWLKSVKDIPVIAECGDKKMFAGGINRCSDDKWFKTIMKSFSLLEGRHGYLYETHLPRKFDSKKLINMFQKFDFRDMSVPYAPSTLYYNLFYEPDVVLQEENKWKAGFYGEVFADGKVGFSAGSRGKIDQAVADKVWINYNNWGLKQIEEGTGRECLKEWLLDKYSKKSRFEK